MSSQPRITREEERRLNLRTLTIASAASATAALVTSQFWAGGTPIAAAVTPVIVTIVSELLNRPTEKIVQKFTVETRALPDTERQAPGPGPPTTRPAPPPAGPPPARPASVYRQPKKGLRWRGIAVTAALAFVIGALILTVPELIAGESLGRGSGSTSYFGGKSDKPDDPADEQEQPPAVTEPSGEQPAPTPTTPRSTPSEPPETESTPTVTTPPAQTTPAPR